MTSETPSLAERMKATIYCLVLSEIPRKEDLLRTYLSSSLAKQPHCAKLVFDFCCEFLVINDAEFAHCDDCICDILRLAGVSEEVSVGQLAAFLANQQVNNDVLKITIRERFTSNGLSLRETIAKDTMQLLRIEEFWTVSRFAPLMKNIGRFENLENQFVCTLFDILSTYKVNADKFKVHHECTCKLMELAKVWLQQTQNRIVVRKKLILNQLYERILEKRSTAVMSSVLNLVEVEILNALLSPIPIETVPPLVKELINWAKLWYYNCTVLLPPIIKLLTRLVHEGKEVEYNQIALDNCDKMLTLVVLPAFRPLISIICHFYRTNTCPERILYQTSESVQKVLIRWQGDADQSVTANLGKSLDALTQRHPEHRDLVIKWLSECSEQRYDSNTNFTVNESPKGLVNTGNTCYANSVIQCLFYSTEFRNKVLLQKPKGSQTLVSNMQQIFALLKFSNSTVIYPEESFHTALRPPYFVRGQQEDGFLYLSYILDMLKEQELKALGIKDDEMEVVKEDLPSEPMKLDLSSSDTDSPSQTEPHLELYANDGEMAEEASPESKQDCQSCAAVKSETKDEIELCAHPIATNNNIPDESDSEAAEDAYHTLSQEVFGGYQVETFSCHGCRFKHKQTKRTSAICLAIPDRENHKSNVSELLEAYFQPVSLQDSERYECRSCKVKVDSTCYTELVTAPKCLVLCLKRFFYDKGLQRTLKITTDVQIEEEIQVKGYDFRIYAIVVHSGSSASHGHYYALVNTENGLLKLDDNMVVNNSCQLGQLDTPYILFYQRKDCRADDQDVTFEQLDASLKGFVKAYRGRNRFGWSGGGSNYKRPQPPPPPEPPSSCSDGPSLSSNRMIF